MHAHALSDVPRPEIDPSNRHRSPEAVTSGSFVGAPYNKRVRLPGSPRLPSIAASTAATPGGTPLPSSPQTLAQAKSHSFDLPSPLPKSNWLLNCSCIWQRAHIYASAYSYFPLHAQLRRFLRCGFCCGAFSCALYTQTPAIPGDGTLDPHWTHSRLDPRADTSSPDYRAGSSGISLGKRNLSRANEVDRLLARSEPCAQKRPRNRKNHQRDRKGPAPYEATGV